MWYSAGSRDPEAIDDPERFDVSRQKPPHQAFGGGGAHFCLGNALARLELRVLFEELMRRMPDMQFAGPITRSDVELLERTHVDAGHFHAGQARRRQRHGRRGRPVMTVSANPGPDVARRRASAGDGRNSQRGEACGRRSVSPRAHAKSANGKRASTAFPGRRSAVWPTPAFTRCPSIPNSVAGLTYPFLATCTATEEIAYQSSSMAGVYDGQCILVPKALSFADPDLRGRIIPGLVSGEMVFAFATTEPDASSDLSVDAMKTTAKQTPSGFVVNGRKRWITNSPVADWVTVLCRSGRRHDDAGDRPQELRGIRVGAPDLKMGHRGQLTADIVFDNVKVPASNVLGQVGNGLAVALATLTYGRVGIAAAGVGVAQAALDLAVERMRTRILFGKPLGAMQHWQYRLAEQRDPTRMRPHPVSESGAAHRRRRILRRARSRDGQDIRDTIGGRPRARRDPGIRRLRIRPASVGDR